MESAILPLIAEFISVLLLSSPASFLSWGSWAVNFVNPRLNFDTLLVSTLGAVGGLELVWSVDYCTPLLTVESCSNNCDGAWLLLGSVAG